MTDREIMQKEISEFLKSKGIESHFLICKMRVDEKTSALIFIGGGKPDESVVSLGKIVMTVVDATGIKPSVKDLSGIWKGGDK